MASMRAGLVVPQGLQREYAGWEPRQAWERTVEVALRAERLGFDALWAYDHLHTMPRPTDANSFESFTVLAGLAPQTSSVRLGQLVMCSGFRNPALASKMIATLDVVSGGRAELGIGSGWKRDEWEAYGYGFPPPRERSEILSDSLEIITRMLGPGRASFEGKQATVHEAINEPRGLQRPRVPIVVGGNGQKVTWRLAARHADELNLDGLSPEDVKKALPIIARRCEEEGRDPDTLSVSANLWSSFVDRPSQQRTQMLAEYRGLGLKRVQTAVPTCVESDDPLESLAADCVTAGIDMRAPEL
jgi:F420-dependent oxidoreductase-like protein